MHSHVRLLDYAVIIHYLEVTKILITVLCLAGFSPHLVPIGHQ